MPNPNIYAEIYRNLAVLCEDEEMLVRVAKYLRKLVKEQQKKADPTLMSKEKFFRKLDEAEESIAQGRYISFDSLEDMDEWLKSL